MPRSEIETLAGARVAVTDVMSQQGVRTHHLSLECSLLFLSLLLLLLVLCTSSMCVFKQDNKLGLLLALQVSLNAVTCLAVSPQFVFAWRLASNQHGRCRRRGFFFLLSQEMFLFCLSQCCNSKLSESSHHHHMSLCGVNRKKYKGKKNYSFI